MSEIAALVKEMADVIASHNHPSVGPMTQGPAAVVIGTQIEAIKQELME